MKLYHVNWKSGEIETLIVIEENIADGATTPTCIVRCEDGSEARVSRTMYHTSEKLALQEYSSQLIDTIRAEQITIFFARKSIRDCNEKLRKAEEQINSQKECLLFINHKDGCLDIIVTHHPIITKELTGSVVKRIVGEILASDIKIYIPEPVLFAPVSIYEKPQTSRGLLFSVII